MPYTRKDLHKDIDALLDAHNFSDDLSLSFGKLHLEVQFQNGKVEVKFHERESFKERTLNPVG